MTLLDRYLPTPMLREVDHVDVAAPAARCWNAVRHGNLARSPLVRALFALRTLPERIAGRREPARLTIDDLAAGEEPGFRLLEEREGEAFAVGAIGRFWEAQIPFRSFEPADFAALADPGLGKVAWEIRLEPRGDHATRIVVEVRVATTDGASWDRFRSYFRLVGPFSRFIRRSLLQQLLRDLGDPEQAEKDRALPGDELVPVADAQATDAITIRAAPSAIWPWLVQMGGRRAGWYSHDRLDNDGVPSARELVPELQRLSVGDVLAALPGSTEGFEVLRIDPERVLALGGLYDLEQGRQVRSGEPRPESFWQVSWTFVLEPLGPQETRLVARARVAFATPAGRARLLLVAPVHHLMQREQLENLKVRAEGRPVHTARDVAEGAVGAMGMLLDLGTPFLRGVRSRWGLSQEDAERALPGDGIVPEPSWSWTHGVTIDAPPEKVWPWVVQIGQDRAGFYSYQWLENLAGCKVQNAEAIHPEWQERRVGDELRLHPDAPPLVVDAIEPGRWFVVRTPRSPDAELMASWLFFVEPLPDGRSRMISRYRVAHGDGLRERLFYGPWTIESVGFVMDRRMLLGVKERAEGRQRAEWSSR